MIQGPEGVCRVCGTAPAEGGSLALARMDPGLRTAADRAAWLARNAVDSLPSGELAAKLEQADLGRRPLRVKLGIDPTAPDLHLGHAVVLRKLAEFQQLGHTIVLIVGDYTARVGDPSGRSRTRPVLSPEQIEANARSFSEQAAAVIDIGSIELRFNGEWLDMEAEQLFALARTTTVAQLLERDDFAKRYGAHEPISVLELLYPLLQGYDSVAVAADLELGGTDQKFNLLLGRDVQRAYGHAQQAILTMPILPGLDGVQKMSKSLGNDIGVSEPPGEMYAKTLSLPDGALAQWWELLSDAPAPAGLPARDTKRALARELVTRFHGAEAARRAEQEFDRVFVERGVPEQIDESSFIAANGSVHVPALIAELFDISRSEARRLQDQGAVRVNGEPLRADERDVGAERLDGAVLAIGKRRHRQLRQAE